MTSPWRRLFRCRRRWAAGRPGCGRRVNPARRWCWRAHLRGHARRSGNHMRVTRVGAGPAVTYMEASTIANPPWCGSFIDTAQKEGIPWQFARQCGRTTPRHSLSRAGVPSATSRALPLIHSPRRL